MNNGLFVKKECKNVIYNIIDMNSYEHGSKERLYRTQINIIFLIQAKQDASKLKTNIGTRSVFL